MQIFKIKICLLKVKKTEIIIEISDNYIFFYYFCSLMCFLRQLNSIYYQNEVKD